MTKFVEFDAIDDRRELFYSCFTQGSLENLYLALSEVLIRVSWEGTPELLRDNYVKKATSVDTFEETLERLGYKVERSNLRLNRQDLQNAVPCLLSVDQLKVVAVSCHDEHVVLYDYANGIFINEPYTDQEILVSTITHYSRTYRDSDAERKSDKWVNHLFFEHFDEVKSLFVLSLVINILGAVGPFFIMGVYNFAVPSESYGTLIWLTIGSIFVAFLEYIFKLLRMRILSTSGKELAIYISYHVTNKLLWLPYKLTSGAGANAQLTRLRDIDQFRKLVTSESTISYFDMPFFFVFLIAIVLISGKAALTVVAGVLLIFAFGAYTRIASGHAQSKSSKANSMATYQWSEMIYGITSIQGLPATTVMSDRFKAAMEQSINDGTVLANENSKNQGFGQALTQTIGAASIVITVLAVINGDVDAGAMMAVIILVWKAITPLMGIFNSLSKFKQISASSAQINALMSMPDDRLNMEKSLPLEMADGTYTIDNLSFRHPGAPKGLTQLAFNTKPGEKVAIAGPSGCGKTSLLNILFGLIDAYQGEVKLSNLNIRQFNSFRLRQAVGYVPMDFTFFNGTLRSNFELYNGAFEEEVMHDWIKRFDIGKWLPSGLDTKINTAFIEELPTSVKESLRISIAFGPLNKGVYLIDEPCLGAGIDAKRIFTSILTDLMSHKMVVYSTNDKQLITACDNCLLLDNDGGQKYYGFPDKVLSTL